MKGERVVLLKIKKETEIELKMYEPCGRVSSVPMSLSSHFRTGDFQVLLLASPFLHISTGAFQPPAARSALTGRRELPQATKTAVQVPEPGLTRYLIYFKWKNAWIFKLLFQEIDKVVCPWAMLFGFWNMDWFSLPLQTEQGCCRSSVGFLLRECLKLFVINQWSGRERKISGHEKALWRPKEGEADVLRTEVNFMLLQQNTNRHSSGPSTLQWDICWFRTTGEEPSLTRVVGGRPLGSCSWHSSGSSGRQFLLCPCLLGPEEALGDGLASCSLLWLQLWQGIWSPRLCGSCAALPGPPHTGYMQSEAGRFPRTGRDASVKELPASLLWRPCEKEACSPSFWAESHLKETIQNDATAPHGKIRESLSAFRTSVRQRLLLSF